MKKGTKAQIINELRKAFAAKAKADRKARGGK